MPLSQDLWWVTGTQSTCWNFSWADRCYSFECFWRFFQLKWRNICPFHLAGGPNLCLVLNRVACGTVKVHLWKIWVRFLFLYLCFPLSLCLSLLTYVKAKCNFHAQKVKTLEFVIVILSNNGCFHEIYFHYYFKPVQTFTFSTFSVRCPFFKWLYVTERAQKYLLNCQ